MIKIVKGAIFGLAVADALGVPVEFESREKLQKNPVDKMLGYGSHAVPKGTWSDDTSMALCTLNSIANKGKIDLTDNILEFSKWAENGYMTPHGEMFDIGRTTLISLRNYWNNKNVYTCGCKSDYDNGNGSLMRIIPVSLFNCFKTLSTKESIRNVHEVSALTHAHERSLIACGIYDFIVRELIKCLEKTSINTAIKKAEKYYANYKEIKYYKRIFDEKFIDTDISLIKSSGYVVDTLEAAVWCLLNTDNYKACVLKAVNLGDDTDTVAAVAGGLAGVLYGYDSIPKEWINTLVKNDMISKLCYKFVEGISW
ncbi:MAG: ADP-ribosylglycohydrolase family protein [Acutalibacteraceae bacterium]